MKDKNSDCLNSHLTNSLTLAFFLFCFIVWTGGHILCHGNAAGAAWTSWTVYCVFIQCSSKVSTSSPPFIFFLSVMFCFCFKLLLSPSLSSHCKQPKNSSSFFNFNTCLHVFLQHHLFCFELSGHCDDGRPHQTIFSHHDRVQSHLPVQGLRLATKTSTPVYINGTLLKFPLVFPPSAMSYGLLCLAMSYLTHLMGDSVLQASLQEVVVIVEQRRVCPAFLSDLCTV